MAAADADADDGCHRRCQRGTGQPQTHGEHENVVEHHVEQTAAQRRHHGKGRVAVVAHKGRHDVVAHEEGREHEEDAGIRDAQRHDARIAAHQPQKAPGCKDAHQQKRHTERTGAEDGVGKILLAAVIALGFEDGVAGGRAQADHGADGKDEVIHRQAEVQQGDAVGARRLRDKIGIGQNVARSAKQAEDVLRYIFKELLCQVHQSFPFFHDSLYTVGYCNTMRLLSQHKKAIERVKWLSVQNDFE